VTAGDSLVAALLVASWRARFRSALLLEQLFGGQNR